jgi:hypothetical protein
VYSHFQSPCLNLLQEGRLNEPSVISRTRDELPLLVGDLILEESCSLIFETFWCCTFVTQLRSLMQRVQLRFRAFDDIVFYATPE